MLNYKKLGIGLLFSAGLTGALLALITFCVLKIGVLPGDAANVLTMIAGAMSVLFASILTGRWARERGLLHGTALAVMYSGIFFASAVALCGIPSVVFFVLRATTFVLCGALGGVIGVSHTDKVKF